MLKLIGIYRTDVIHQGRLTRSYFAPTVYQLDDSERDALSSRIQETSDIPEEVITDTQLMHEFAHETRDACTPVNVPDFIKGVDTLHQMMHKEFINDEKLKTAFYFIPYSEALETKAGVVYCVDDYRLKHFDKRYRQERCSIDFIDYISEQHFDTDDIMLQAIIDGALSVDIKEDSDILSIKAINFDFFDGKVDVSAFGRLQGDYDVYLKDLEKRNYQATHSAEYFHAFADKFFCEQYGFVDKRETD